MRTFDFKYNGAIIGITVGPITKTATINNIKAIPIADNPSNFDSAFYDIIFYNF